MVVRFLLSVCHNTLKCDSHFYTYRCKCPLVFKKNKQKKKTEKGDSRETVWNSQGQIARATFPYIQVPAQFVYTLKTYGLKSTQDEQKLQLLAVASHFYRAIMSFKPHFHFLIGCTSFLKSRTQSFR